MENKELFEIINTVIDTESKALVGILMKRIEVLDKEKSLSPILYKSLVKENIYEFSRRLKTLLNLHIKIGRVEFKSRPTE